MKPTMLRAFMRRYDSAGTVFAGLFLLLRVAQRHRLRFYCATATVVLVGLITPHFCHRLGEASVKPNLHPIGSVQDENAPPRYRLTDLSAPEYPFSVPYDLNANGQVVGAMSRPGHELHAFIWSDNKMIDLGTLGGDRSLGYGINNRDQVVGASNTPGANRAFLWQQGKMTGLGGQDSSAASINDSGQIVGLARTPAGYWHATLWNDGNIIDLGVLPKGSYSYAVAINDLGQVTGTAHGDTDAAGYAAQHAFIWERATGMRDLGTLGGRESFAYGINNRGQIVGDSRVKIPHGETRHAFLWQRGGMSDLGTLNGYRFSRARSINDSGVIVGEIETPGKHYAAIWNHGRIWNLNDLVEGKSDWTLTVAYAINDQGKIAAYGYRGENLGGERHALLLTPVSR